MVAFASLAPLAVNCRSVSAQQVVDAGLGAGLGVDLLHDDGAIQAVLAVGGRQVAGYHHRAGRDAAVEDLAGLAIVDGVLEPLQANPTIIEDNCFIGARSEVVEGVIVEAHSVLAMGVYISQSTKIYDRATGEVHYGRVPSGSVVVPGSLPSADGKYSLACAVIVKRVDATTRAKTSINELLRD